MLPGALGIRNQSVIHPRHPLPHAEPFTLIATGGTFSLDYDEPLSARRLTKKPTKVTPLNMHTVMDPGSVLIRLYNTVHQGYTTQHVQYTVMDPGRVLICLYNILHQGYITQHVHSDGSREGTDLSV